MTTAEAATIAPSLRRTVLPRGAGFRSAADCAASSANWSKKAASLAGATFSARKIAAISSGVGVFTVFPCHHEVKL
jgi:hypothetical protein